MRRGTVNRFCWLDLKTHQPTAAEDFLAAALGWRFAVDTGDWRQAVKIHTADGQQVGGVSDLSAPVYPPGTPPHIAYYLAVADVDGCAGTAEAAGATLVLEPTGIADQGRVATLVDPAGAPFSLWQPDRFHGWAEPDRYRMLHFSGDPVGCRDFYRTVLGGPLAGADFVTADSGPAAPERGATATATARWEAVITPAGGGQRSADTPAPPAEAGEHGGRPCRCLPTPDGPRLHLAAAPQPPSG